MPFPPPTLPPSPRRGLGRAISIQLAAAGCSHVCVNYRANEASAKETAQLITSAHPSTSVHLYQCDVSEAEQVQSMVSAIEREVGAVGILVNNAGVSSVRELSEVTLDDFDRMMRVNVRSAFICTQATYEGMVKQGWGRIIFLTSIAAYIGGVTGVRPTLTHPSHSLCRRPAVVGLHTCISL